MPCILLVLRLLAMFGGALAVGGLVWLSVGADAVALFRAAWWAPVVMLAFPAFMGFAVWRGWGD